MAEDERGVADVLDPAETVAGVDGVKRLVNKARKVWLVSDPDTLAPCRLTKRAARALLDRMAAGEAGRQDGGRRRRRGEGLMRSCSASTSSASAARSASSISSRRMRPTMKRKVIVPSSGSATRRMAAGAALHP